MYQSILAFMLIILAGCGKVDMPAQPENREPENAIYPQQTVPYPIDEPFNITLVGVDTMYVLQSRHKRAIERAAEKWEDIITEGLPAVGRIDDIEIRFYWQPESWATWLASGGPFRYRNGPNGLPYYAVINITKVLIDGNYSDEAWETIMLHEMGHALGFVTSMLERVGTETIMGTRFFNGPFASDAYRSILSDLGAKMVHGIPDFRVPLQPDEWDSHWKYPALQWELMTDRYIWGNKLTLVTIQAMADMGYMVDVEQAEEPLARLTKLAVGPVFICDGKHTWVANQP